MAPSDPPGFAPPQTVVAPEVFEQMRIYMNCADLEERNIREARMRKTLQELSNDPIGNVLAYALRKHQCSSSSQEHTRHATRSRGEGDRTGDMNQQLLVETQQRTDKMQRDDGYVADGEEGLLLNEEGSCGFVIGSGTSPVRDRGSRSRNSHSSRSSWVRRNQNRRMSSQWVLVEVWRFSGSKCMR
ncbi:hypothetical protein F2Q69_00013677 [Brassica cretica]|uniref:Uncharacterized protein n=1 Tax=Brassica cretica TaxID=69181 RepID=A0A8S9QR57_BRACR|nr:hypothetical protein F2Q69_00013677 [Brassica cretica]